MPIFNTKSKAKKAAEKLASEYDIQYGPEGETFSIYAKGDIGDVRGRTDLLVAADRWLPSLSRKKRLTTKYYQKFAEERRLAELKKQKAKDEAAAIAKALAEKALVDKKLITDADPNADPVVDDKIIINADPTVKKNIISNTNIKSGIKKRKGYIVDDLVNIDEEEEKKENIISDLKDLPKDNSSSDAWWKYISNTYANDKGVPSKSYMTTTYKLKDRSGTPPGPLLEERYPAYGHITTEGIPANPFANYSMFNKPTKLKEKNSKIIGDISIPDHKSDTFNNVFELDTDMFAIKDLANLVSKNIKYIKLGNKVVSIQSITDKLHTVGLLEKKYLNENIIQDIHDSPGQDFLEIKIEDIPEFRTEKEAAIGDNSWINSAPIGKSGNMLFKIKGKSGIYQFIAGALIKTNTQVTSKGNLLLKVNYPQQ